MIKVLQISLLVMISFSFASEFSESALQHVQILAGFGERAAGTPAEQKTIEYLLAQLYGMDVDVQLDSFWYGGYMLPQRSIMIEQDLVPVQTFSTDSEVSHGNTFRSKCVYLKSKAAAGKDLAGSIVLTSISNHSVVLSKYEPKVIIVIDGMYVDVLERYDQDTIEVTIPGQVRGEMKMSYNVIATLPGYTNEDQKEIILTAHWDSQKGPGASDNASGVAVLLELVEHYQQRSADLAVDLRFVFTGAEEAGLVGSKAYIMQYANRMNNCILNINIDGVGAGKVPYIEMRNPIDFREIDTSENLELVVTNHPQRIWYTSFLELYRNSSSEQIYPLWLGDIIRESMDELDLRYKKASCCSGADHRSFAYLELPVVFLNMYSRNSKKIHNTPADLPEKIIPESLDKAGLIAMQLIDRSINAQIDE